MRPLSERLDSLPWPKPERDLDRIEIERVPVRIRRAFPRWPGNRVRTDEAEYTLSRRFLWRERMELVTARDMKLVSIANQAAQGFKDSVRQELLRELGDSVT